MRLIVKEFYKLVNKNLWQKQHTNSKLIKIVGVVQQRKNSEFRFDGREIL